MIVAVLSSEVSSVPFVAVAVMVAVPTLKPITRPLLSTATTPELLELQITFPFAPLGVMLAVNNTSEPPTNNSSVSGSIVTLSTSGFG